MRHILVLPRALPRRSLQAPRASLPVRHLSTTSLRLNAQPTPKAGLNPSQTPVEGAADISHSHFISSASPHSDFNPTQSPSAGLETSHKWEGKLSPTTSHLFKLILPLPSSSGSSRSDAQPTAFLLHPSQPLSHLSRLIAGSLPPSRRDVEISYLALTGPESDLDSHLRNAEEEEAAGAGGEPGQGTARQEGGPYLQERQRDKGKLQEVSWSQSTDLSDFIKQSCLNEKFKIRIKPNKAEESVDGGEGGEGMKEMVLEVVIPSFESRTRYLRRRLLDLTKELDGMTKQKKQIDVEAHKGARQLIVAGLVAGVGYWAAVVRWTFFTEAGWDVMEPVTWAVGFGGLLASAAFLAYHNREVSYSSILDLSVTARQQALYAKHGLDIERWTEMVAEAKGIRKEIIRIAADYDIEWKGELENLAKLARRDMRASSNPSNSDGGGSPGKKIDIDKTIDEADELASHSKEQKEKEKAAQRKGEVRENDQVGKKREEGGGAGKDKRSSVQIGEDRAEELAKK